MVELTPFEYVPSESHLRRRRDHRGYWINQPVLGVIYFSQENPLPSGTPRPSPAYSLRHWGRLRAQRAECEHGEGTRRCSCRGTREEHGGPPLLPRVALRAQRVQARNPVVEGEAHTDARLGQQEDDRVSRDDRVATERRRAATVVADDRRRGRRRGRHCCACTPYSAATARAAAAAAAAPSPYAEAQRARTSRAVLAPPPPPPVPLPPPPRPRRRCRRRAALRAVEVSYRLPRARAAAGPKRSAGAEQHDEDRGHVGRLRRAAAPRSMRLLLRLALIESVVTPLQHTCLTASRARSSYSGSGARRRQHRAGAGGRERAERGWRRRFRQAGCGQERTFDRTYARPRRRSVESAPKKTRRAGRSFAGGPCPCAALPEASTAPESGE